MLSLYLRLTNLWSSLWKRQEGQSLVEYALIIVLLSIVVAGVLMLLGTRLSNIFDTLKKQLG